ncbi:MAG: glycosyltransferase family A protein [Pyrinomonadaceae bacterium]
MKFSVLLPTRNRLDYLKYAVETVVRQDYDDWELIISDNCSEEDIAGYVRSLNDPRIKYYRTESFVPVTDNWNNALDRSSGDYVIMLGDDDCLMKSYFTTLHRLINEYDRPEAIYSRAYVYAYPGVMPVPGLEDGYLELAGLADFLKSAKEPFWLNKEQGIALVKQSMNFRLPFDYNMQYVTVSRKHIDSLHNAGQFFQSPFPDYYAMNVLFLKAERILVYPFPLVTIGITPKSYGFYHFNKRETEGAGFLKNHASAAMADRLRRVIMPGTSMNTGWLLAMETIKANYGHEIDLHVNHRRYRLLQMINIYEDYYLHHRLTKEDLRELKNSMSLWERQLFNLIGLTPESQRGAMALKLRSLLKQYPEVYPKESSSATKIFLKFLNKTIHCMIKRLIVVAPRIGIEVTDFGELLFDRNFAKCQ